MTAALMAALSIPQQAMAEEVPGVTATFELRYGYSIIGIGNSIGMGTAVSATGETFVAGIPEQTAGRGFALGVRVGDSGNGIFFSATQAQRSSSAGATATVGADGVTAVYLTGLVAEAGLFPGPSTNVPGNYLTASASYAMRWDEFAVGYWSSFHPGANDELRIELYAGVAGQSLLQASSSFGQLFNSQGVQLITRMITTSTSNQFFGVRLGGAVSYALADCLTISVGGFVSPLLNQARGTLDQQGGGNPFQVNLDELGMAFEAGADIRMVFAPGPHLQISAGVQLSRLSGVRTALLPETSAEYPAIFGRGAMNRLSFNAGLSLSF